MRLGKNARWILSITVFVLLAYWVGRTGLANVSYLRASQYLESWHSHEALGDANSVSKALEFIQRANTLHPDHPHYLNTYASILVWRGDSLTNSNEQMLDYREALELYKRSAQRRPMWPDTWTAMAMIKWRLNEFDEEMHYYIGRADRLGPFAYDVHMDLVKLGFALRQRDPFTRYDFFKRHLLRGVDASKSRRGIIAQIKSYNASTMACRWLAQAKQLPPPGLCSQ